MRTHAMAVAFFAAIASSTAAISAERMIEKQVVVNAPIEEVWKAWTTTDGVKGFFAPDANVDARVGGPFEVYMNPYAEPGMKGADDMRFMALQEPTMLSFTWNAPPSNPEIRKQRTLVIVRLKPTGEKQTEVTLHHVGWGEGEKWDMAYRYFEGAWNTVLGNLQKRFVSGPVDWTTWLDRLREIEKERKSR